MHNWKGFSTKEEAERFASEHPDFHMAVWTEGDDWYETTVALGGMDRKKYPWCVLWDEGTDDRVLDDRLTEKVGIPDVDIFRSSDGFYHYEIEWKVFDKRLGIRIGDKLDRDIISIIRHRISSDIRRTERGINLWWH